LLHNIATDTIKIGTLPRSCKSVEKSGGSIKCMTMKLSNVCHGETAKSY